MGLAKDSILLFMLDPLVMAANEINNGQDIRDLYLVKEEIIINNKH